MRNKDTKNGFTIIEILLAMFVLGIGVIGILALFPVGIQRTKESVDDSIASMYADSIKSAIINAMRGQETSGWVTMNHNGCRNGSYRFLPPTMPGGVQVYPAVGEGNWPAGSNYLFQLGSATSDLSISNTVVNIQENYDPSESTRQYQFFFSMTRDIIRPYFTVSIQIFRNYSSRVGWGQDRRFGNWATMKHPDQIRDFSFIVSGL